MTPRWKKTPYYRALPAWKRALLENPDAFVLKYFPHRIEHLKDFHTEMLDAMDQYVRTLILEPAGHGKSTLGAEIMPILWICRNPNIRVLLISKNDQESENRMRSIQSELIDNQALVRDFGPFVPATGKGKDKQDADVAKAWSLGRIDVAQRTRRGGSSTLAGIGAGAKTALGYRTDVTICVPPGTQVQTRRGPVAVEQLHLVDEVLTHKGRFKPIDAIVRRHVEGLSAIQVATQPKPVEMTVTHPVLTPNGWVPAGAIKPGDEIAAAMPLEEHDHEWGEDFWYLAGWWLAEGGLESRYVRLTLGTDERDIAEHLRDIGAKYGTSANLRDRASSGSIEVLIYGKRVIDFFKEWDRDGVCQKAIPGWVEMLPELKLRELLRGYFQGDGTKNHGEHATGWRVNSVALPMLQGVQRCLARTGRWASICNMPARRGQPSYVLLAGGETAAWLELSRSPKKPGRQQGWRFDGERVWLKVKSNEIVERASDVFDLTVADDHSFSAGALMTHNCDDVVTQDNSATATQREKMRDWFDLCVETGPEFEDSQLVVIGTRFDPSDLYGDLIEIIDPETGMTPWAILQKDAVVDEEAHVTLWPEQWSWKRLMAKKASIGTLSFNKRYRNIAVDESSIIVREAWIRGGWDRGHHYKGCLDRDHAVGDIDDSWRVICGFDPAGGSTRKAKFCAHLTLALGSCPEHERCLWVVDLLRDQWTQPQQVDLIIRQHQQYDARMTVVEANSLQIGLLQQIQLKTEEQGIAITVEPHYTTRSNKPDPDIGVEAMSPWFEKGWVHIPWADAHSQRRMSQFVDELCLYAGKDSTRTTDTVMAFWFAWLKLQLHQPVYAAFNRLSKTKARPWAPRQGRTIKNPYYADKVA